MLLLTGRPGIGKTTLVRRVVEGLPGRRLAGFYTEEIRAERERQGFCLLGFNGVEQVIAHVDFAKPPQVGKYGVDVNAIDGAVEACLSLDPEPSLVIVDEIGKMECLSAQFVKAIRRVLESRSPLLATIAARGGGLIAELKQRPASLLWEINAANRDAMCAQVLNWLIRRKV